MKNTDLIHGSIMKSIIVFSIPLFISYLFQTFYNTADTFIIGRFLGDTSLAAIGSVGAIYELLIGFANGIGTGLTLVTSRYFGSGDRKMLRKSVAGTLMIGFFFALVIAFSGYVLIDPLMSILKTPEDIYFEARSYIVIIISYSVFIFAYNLFSGVLRAVGDSFRPLVFLIISSLINIVLDYFFIAQLKMGVEGAAIATVIAQGISAVLCLIYISVKRKELIPDIADFRIGKELFTEMTLQGLSMGFMSSVVSLGSVILQYGINGLGTLTIAAHQAGRKVYNITMMPMLGISLAMPTFVGQNAGAGEYGRIKKALIYTYIIDAIMALFITVLTFIFGRQLVAFVSGSNKELVLNNAYYYILVAAPFFGVLGPLLTTRNSLQALGEKFVPLISSFIECAGKIVFCFVFIPLFGYNAVIFCEPLIWCVMTVQLVYTIMNLDVIKYASCSNSI